MLVSSDNERRKWNALLPFGVSGVVNLFVVTRSPNGMGTCSDKTVLTGVLL